MPRSAEDSDLTAPQQDHRRQLAELRTALAGGSTAFGLNKSTSNLFRHRKPASRPKLNLSGFNRVLRVDPGENTARIQGMATYESIVDALLPLGYMPKVVPELKTITLGGAVTGVGIESSSFRYGLVHETVREIEILTGSGEVVTAGPGNTHADLYFGFPNSYGSLGYALSFVIDILRVEPYVHVENRRHRDHDGFFRDLEELCADRENNHFVDGAVFGRGDMVLMRGRFANGPPYASDYTYRNIYYRSLRERGEDYLSIRDYLWRWDTDWFWCSSHFGAQHPWIRPLFGKKRLRSSTYWQIRSFCARHGITNLLEKLGTRTEAVIQDVEIPLDKAPAFLAFFQEKVGIRPVWVCPIRALDPSRRYTLYEMDPGTLYVNFGFWDTVPSDKPRGYYNRLVEDKVMELGGVKSLYSDSYYSEEVFWKLYNQKAYSELKSRYDPSGRLPDLYSKCVRNA